MSDWETVLAILGMAVVTLLTRCFFLIPDKEVRLPEWLRRSLRYAPLAALGAVLAPEILMRDGQLLNTLMDARLPAAALAMGFYFWKRSILGTIVTGMLVYLPLHIGLGW
ncbi:Branched-chain amino acid transport protein [Polaromonas sp. OV174]|uniref:AzlD domain-containing protein n=1 Tax=Polaromonas sp. OV174 TaxID=1855300 RepID=UPI0008EA7CF5|nr:AzlD domain-containing protein [Polaromonas sp. OV174]SFC30322.1 Branched-chain amino acid transport protein [Polaromonas sp. OV174]